MAIDAGNELPLYQVSVADQNGSIVWQREQRGVRPITVSAGVLQRGAAYSWQVERVADGVSSLSPPTTFWVLDEESLREVEQIERTFRGSALVLATTLAAHGLYDEALAYALRLEALNPGDASLVRFADTLRRQIGAN